VGGDISDRAALSLLGSTGSVLYTTIGAGFGASSALSCDAGATATIDNSILVSRSGDPELACASATVNYSATETESGGTNTTLDAMDTDWFVGFTSVEFHLNATADRKSVV